MFLKQKRTGKIKGWGCADGWSQRVYTPKDEAWSPTVMTEAMLLSCFIDAKEGHCVMTVDIPGAKLCICDWREHLDEMRPLYRTYMMSYNWCVANRQSMAANAPWFGTLMT